LIKKGQKKKEIKKNLENRQVKAPQHKTNRHQFPQEPILNNKIHPVILQIKTNQQ
jgi:hypothetical protein